MSAELLRRAANQMRERAEAALAYPEERWVVDQSPDYGLIVGSYMPGDVDEDGYISTGVLCRFAYDDDDQNRAPARSLEAATHIASWHPAVALAVADWLDVASQWNDAGIGGVNMDYAVAVARAYLGESA